MRNFSSQKTTFPYRPDIIALSWNIFAISQEANFICTFHSEVSLFIGFAVCFGLFLSHGNLQAVGAEKVVKLVWISIFPGKVCVQFKIRAPHWISTENTIWLL